MNYLLKTSRIFLLATLPLCALTPETVVAKSTTPTSPANTAHALASTHHQKPTTKDFSRKKEINITEGNATNGQTKLTAELLLPKGEPRLGKTFDVMICSAWLLQNGTAGEPPAAVEIEVVMPEHSHGMSVVPKKTTGSNTTSQKQSCQIWKGLRFDMSGWWLLKAKFLHKGHAVQADFNFDIKN